MKIVPPSRVYFEYGQGVGDNTSTVLERRESDWGSASEVTIIYFGLFSEKCQLLR